MNTEVYTQNDPKACAQMDLVAGARMLAEICVRMYPKTYAQIMAESCTQMNPAACAQMNPVACAQMNPVACAQMNPVACAQMNLEASAQTDHIQEDIFGKGYTGSSDIERDIERSHPSVADRIIAARHRFFTNRRVTVERDLSCPAYAFSADLVRYVMRCYLESHNRNTFEFTDEFGHDSPVTYFNTQIAGVLRIVLDDRQELIHATYAHCFRHSHGNDVKREMLRCRMEVLRIAVEIGHIRSTVDLLNLCIFLAHFSAIAHADGLHSAKYMALDIVYWNMVQFIRIILGSDSKYFWQIMPDTCHVLACEVKERKLVNFLCQVMLDPAKMPQYGSG